MQPSQKEPIAYICFLFILTHLFGFNYWSNISTQKDYVFSVDAPTHQVFGEKYTKAITSESGGLLSNRFAELGYGSRFPDKYPPGFHIAVSIIQKVTGQSWSFCALTLLWTCFVLLIIVLYLICINFETSKDRHLFGFISVLPVLGMLAADDSLNSKGVGLYSTFLVGLYAQLFMTLFYMINIYSCAKYFSKGDKRYLILGAVCSSICFWSNFLAYPIYIVSSFVLIFLNYPLRNKMLWICSTLVLGILSTLPWLKGLLSLAYLSPTLTTYLPLKDHFAHESYFIWPLYIFSLVASKKYFKIRLLPLLILIISLLWTSVYESLSLVSYLEWIFKLPLQMPRYWVYLYIFMGLSSFMVLLPLMKKWWESKIPQLTFFIFPFIIISLLPVFHDYQFNQVYISQTHVDTYREIANVINEDKKTLSDKFKNNSITMVGVGEFLIRKDDKVIPQFGNFASSLKRTLALNQIATNQVGYRENSVMQLLTLPIQNKLTGLLDIALVYIPTHYNKYLAEVLSTKDYLELLQSHYIKYIVCPRAVTKAKAVCIRDDLKNYTTELYNKNFWRVLRIDIPRRHRKLDILVLTDITTKYRSNIDDLSYINLYENLVLANFAPSLKMSFVDINRPKEVIEKISKKILESTDIILIPQKHFEKFKKFNIKYEKRHTAYVFDSFEQLQNMLNKKIMHSTKIYPYQNDMPIVYDHPQKTQGLVYVEAPFFEVQVKN